MGLSWPSIQGLGIASRRASTMSGSDVTVSRFPVPEIDSLPKDVQERIKEVEEKVYINSELPTECIFLHFCQ